MANPPNKYYDHNTVLYSVREEWGPSFHAHVVQPLHHCAPTPQSRQMKDILLVFCHVLLQRKQMKSNGNVQHISTFL